MMRLQNKCYKISGSVQENQFHPDIMVAPRHLVAMVRRPRLGKHSLQACFGALSSRLPIAPALSLPSDASLTAHAVWISDVLLSISLLMLG